MEEQLSDIIDDCLERLEAGTSLEECLALYPQHRQELEELLGTIAEVQEYPWPAIPPTTLAAIETRLLAELQTQQPSPDPASRTPAQPGAPRLPSLIERLMQAAGFGSAMQPWRRVAAITIGLVLALVLGTGALAAARAIINTIAPPPTPVPAITQITTGSTTIATVAGTIQELGPDSWRVRDIVITIDAQTEITGLPQIGAPVTVTGILRNDGTIQAQSITVISLGPSSPSPVPTSGPLSTPVQTQVATVMATAVPAQQLPTAQPGATVVSSPVAGGAPVVTATLTILPALSPSAVSVAPTTMPTSTPPLGQTSVPTQAPPAGQTSVPTQAPPPGQTAVATQVPPPATAIQATEVVLPSAVATNTPTPTATPTTTALPSPAVTPVATATSTPALAATHTPTPSATTPPTNTPTQTATPTVPPVPTDAFEALRALIMAGMADGRAEAGSGQFLLDRLGEAQNAANAGDINELRRRLHDMRRETREELREDRMEPALGEEILDRITGIGDIYGITIPD